MSVILRFIYFVLDRLHWITERPQESSTNIQAKLFLIFRGKTAFSPYLNR
jgi:hypothetical protein